jgi:hypothetical protein
MHRTILPILSCVVAVLLAGRSHADILSVSGSMTILTPPVSVAGEGITESSSTIFIIDEGVSIVPPGPPSLFVNAFGPGPHGDDPASLMMPPGAVFHSYLVHFDPAGGVVSLTGSVTFDPGEIIFGIQTHAPLLYTTDGPFGLPSVAYPGAFIATLGHLHAHGRTRHGSGAHLHGPRARAVVGGAVGRRCGDARSDSTRLRALAKRDMSAAFARGQFLPAARVRPSRALRVCVRAAWLA